MKIFISHSSQNKPFGQELVNLMVSLGISSDKIIFTSNVAHGIPIGNNIFDWLKSQISDKPYVIYLLSPEYYQSIPCLNEMGAAWVIENEHSMIFTPHFDLKSEEFKNGAIDPREIGFFINNKEQLLSFVEILKEKFSITPRPVLVNQKIDECLEKINSIKIKHKTISIAKPKVILESISEPVDAFKIPKVIKQEEISSRSHKSNKFFEQIRNGKTKPEENILLYFVLETDSYRLGTGYLTDNEIGRIKAWEEINELDNILSRNYSSVIQKFEMRNLLEVSELTSHGNPKELKFKEHVFDSLMNIPDDVHEIIEKTIKENPQKESQFGW
ncbi:toll/interleukin-1 receptor domain-containing protein [Flavobacteriaceae bacterium]|jgi:hypothetical protein|nr:toll/interleukin-1 receptor domain-containing protein [Flavobacteriaceae bacterium]